MTYSLSTPGVIRSIRQRDLLNAWARARANGSIPDPVLCTPETFGEEFSDMAIVDGVAEASGMRFKIRRQGQRMQIYHNANLEGGFVDDSLPDHMRDWMVYLLELARNLRSPVYSEYATTDVIGRPLSLERLFLPYGQADAPPGAFALSVKTISLEGAFVESEIMRCNSNKKIDAKAFVIEPDSIEASARAARRADDIVY